MTSIAGVTILHTLISLVAIILGLIAIWTLFQHSGSRLWARSFVLAAILTSATGFLFTPSGISPAQIVGFIALAILLLVLVADHVGGLMGAWRWIYAVGLVASLYLLCFVGIVQAFQKIPVINSLAPTRTELPFLIVQVAALLIFGGLGFMAARAYRPYVENGSKY